MTALETAPLFERMPHRQKVHLLETAMLAHPQVEVPLFHRFADGLYLREIHIAAGVLSTGHIHKYEHIGMLMKGVREMLINGRLTVVVAPFITTIAAGSKLACYTWEDSIYVTVHPNPDNETDIEKLERRYVAETEPDYLTFLETEKKQIECRS